MPDRPASPGFATRAIHAGQAPDPVTGSIMTPVYLTSTYVHEELGRHKGFVYSRVSNPTRTALEENIAALEEGRHGMAFGSGTAAVDAVLRLLAPGDHVIMSRNVYGGTYRIARLVWEEFGLRFSFVDTADLHAVAAAGTPATRMLFIETPTNPTMELTDLTGAAALARERGWIAVADNTFATPVIHQPLAHGFAIVLHSLTKYLNGHSDMLGGLVVTDDDRLAERLRFFQKAVGGILSPFEAWLCLRGVKTLPVRMRRHNESAPAVASWLEADPRVERVFYPGLPSHPQHDLARRQMRGFGGMLTMELGSRERAAAMLSRVRLCALAESLGGVESLICHPASMTHAAIPPEVRAAIGLTEGMVRLSVGLEEVEDIIADLDTALG